MGSDRRCARVVVAVVGGHAGLEGGDPFLPGGVEVGAGWQASGELEPAQAAQDGSRRLGVDAGVLCAGLLVCWWVGGMWASGLGLLGAAPERRVHLLEGG